MLKKLKNLSMKLLEMISNIFIFIHIFIHTFIHIFIHIFIHTFIHIFNFVQMMKLNM